MNGPEKYPKIDLRLENCYEGMKSLPAGSVDLVLTDPPYGMFDKSYPFDSQPFNSGEFARACQHLLSPRGCVVVFGRGPMLWKLGLELRDNGFLFKEEITWVKFQFTSRTRPLGRQHESGIIFTMGPRELNRCFIPYEEKRLFRPQQVARDIRDLKLLLSRVRGGRDMKLETALEEIKDRWLEAIDEKELDTEKPKANTVNSLLKRPHLKECYSPFFRGMKESTVFYVGKYPRFRGSDGSKHPTEKPVRLLERLLYICSNPGDTVLDPFMGSGSTAEACIAANRNFIGYEIHEPYYRLAKERISALTRGGSGV